MSGKSTSVFALEHVRRMRGGAQSQLLRCSDGEYYVVKFQNNPQGIRILANELLAGILAKRLGLPVPECAVVKVSAELIRHSEELVIQLGRGRVPCRSGLCFGSRYPKTLAANGTCLLQVQDLLPEGHFRGVTNLSDFVGMLVFDKWTGNTDDRQSIFFRNQGQFQFTALMIDNGFCFNGQEWNFPDAPRRGICARRFVYKNVKGIEAFEEWTSRLEHDIDESFLRSALEAIPPEWYERDEHSLLQLLKLLNYRRTKVRDLLCATALKLPEFFPNWTCAPSESRGPVVGLGANPALA
ncbi:MAG: HipA family kinase [Candidatus Acidiferrales bacterium]|jgi:HipA-like protein